MSDNDCDGDGYDAAEQGGDDCDDSDPEVSPGAEETWFDGIDQNCDGASDYDRDGDGHDAPEYGGDDCDDLDPDAWRSEKGECAEEQDGDGDGGGCCASGSAAFFLFLAAPGALRRRRGVGSGPSVG